MKRWTTFACAAVMCASAAVAQDDALHGVVRPADFARTAFDRPVTVATTETQGKSTKQQVARFDPAAPVGRRWVLVSVDGVDATADAGARLAATLAKREAPQTYVDVDKYLGTNPVAAGRDADGVLLRQVTLAPRTVVVNGKDVSSSFAATVHVKTAGPTRFIDWIAFTATAPFKIGPATISSAKGSIAFEASDGGEPPRTVRTQFDAAMAFGFGSTTIAKVETFRY